MPISDQALEAIVAAVLAVNNYGLDKAYSLLPALRDAGLTKPAAVAREDLGPLTAKLAAAGYNRGLLTEMMAGRLLVLMKAARSGELDRYDGLVAAGNRDEAIALLCRVHGIGPQVAANAWALLRG